MSGNNSTPTPQRGSIAESVRSQYENSSNYIKIGVKVLEALVVLFTIPHNIYAFAGTDQITWDNLFPFIGVLVIEGTLVFGFFHFTHGWIANKSHLKAAEQTVYTTLGILVANAITAHMLTVIGKENIGPILKWVFIQYETFLLPATPIICVALAARLTSKHPAIVSLGKKLAHLSHVDDMRREAEADREEATVAVEASRISMKQAQLEAEFDAEKISHNADLDELKAAAEREAAERRFIIDRDKSMLALRVTKQQEVLASETFQQYARLAEERQLLNELNHMFPDFDADLLISREVYESERAKITELEQTVEALLSEVDRVARLEDELAATKELLTQAQAEVLSVPLPVGDGLPHYANGHNPAAD